MPLKLVQRHGSDNWYIRGTVRGIRVDESTRTSDRRAAEELCTKRGAEVLEESIHGKRATYTFAQAALSYLKRGGSSRFAAPVIQHFGDTPLARIGQDQIDQAASKLYPKAAPSTRNRQCYTVVSAILTHAAKRGWCAPVLLERPRQPKDRIRYLKPVEAERLLEACGRALQPLVLFMLYTGARAGEALWLDWRQVDLERRHVEFLKTKNGDPRGVPLHPRVVEALKALPNQSGAVFRRPDGKAYSRPRGLTDTSAGTRIKSAFTAACERAAIVDFHPHDCRHTWATWHYAANRDVGALQRLGGWKSVRMVMRYAHTNVDELAATIDRLPGGNLGEPTEGDKKIA